jgi:hypothetical protein
MSGLCRLQIAHGPVSIFPAFGHPVDLPLIAFTVKSRKYSEFSEAVTQLTKIISDSMGHVQGTGPAKIS